MNVLNHEQIRELTKHRSSLSVSLFMSTHRSGRERPQDTIRLQNLVDMARERMLRAHATAVVDTVLRPACDLRSDEVYWRHPSDGLACFCAPDFFRAYRIPIELNEQLVVSDRFHIRPLLPLLRSDARIYILTLTFESARLFETTKYSIREIAIPDVTRFEVGGEQAHPHESRRAPARGRRETESAKYHRQGGAADQAKRQALRFFQHVNRAVTGVLHGQRAPLVLACVGYLAALYESANSYRHLLRGKVPGSPERWSEDELRDHAWAIAEPHFRQDRQNAWRQFQEARGNGRAADQLCSVVLAANQGRVDTLFLVRGERRWGHVDPMLQTVHVAKNESQGEELLAYSAARTISNGGDVFLLDSLPNTKSPAAATFRY